MEGASDSDLARPLQLSWKLLTTMVRISTADELCASIHLDWTLLVRYAMARYYLLVRLTSLIAYLQDRLLGARLAQLFAAIGSLLHEAKTWRLPCWESQYHLRLSHPVLTSTHSTHW